MTKSEGELFPPTKSLFENMGFTVDGEVKNCDLVAVKGDITVIAELKKTFNISLVYQLIERKSITPYVYGVIFRPKNFKASKTKQMLKLVKLLGVGLIVVSENTKIPEEIISPKGDFKAFSINSNRYNKVSKEFNNRTYKENIGGVNKTKIVTAYRENSIAALCFIENRGQIETRKIKDEIKKVLQSNHYQWFYRIKNGVYGITDKGRNVLNNNEFKDVITFYRNEVELCLK